jgi:hypothetical protein
VLNSLNNGSTAEAYWNDKLTIETEEDGMRYLQDDEWRVARFVLADIDHVGLRRNSC